MHLLGHKWKRTGREGIRTLEAQIDKKILKLDKMLLVLVKEECMSFLSYLVYNKGTLRLVEEVEKRLKGNLISAIYIKSQII